MLTFETRTWTTGSKDRSPGAHREQATVTLPDGRFVASRIVGKTSCIADLCRRLVELGVSDGPWQTRNAAGTICLRGKSIHRHARADVRQDDETGASGYHPYVPMTEEAKLELRSSRSPRRQDGVSE